MLEKEVVEILLEDKEILLITGPKFHGLFYRPLLHLRKSKGDES